MTTAKIAITMPEDVLGRARAQVKAGKAKSLSALVSEAVEEKVARDELADVLDAMDAEYGRPGREARSWAKRALGK